MVWPFTRLRTYSPGTPVYGNDLNELQDAVVCHRHGEVQQPIPIAGAYPDPNWTWDDVGMVAPSTGWPRALHVPIPFSRDTLIREITIWWNLRGFSLDAADPLDYLQLSVWSRDPFVDTGWSSTVASPKITDTSTAAGDCFRYTWHGTIYLQPGRLYRLDVLVGQAARRVDGAMATIARP